MSKHGVPINIPRSMTYKEIDSVISSGVHSSANKEPSFVIGEIFEQLQAGRVAIFPLVLIRRLQKIWLSPLSAVPQIGRSTRPPQDGQISIPQRRDALWKVHPQATIFHYIRGPRNRPIILVTSVCSARDSGWGSLGNWDYGLRETLGLKTQGAVAIKESK